MMMNLHRIFITSQKKKIYTVDEVIQIHTSKQYKIYMLGFLPGFAYMGELDEQIAMVRKATAG